MGSDEALRYLVDFDESLVSKVNLLKELPGVGNVVTDNAGSPLVQAIFDALPAAMKRCLTEMSESFARLHFITGPAGTGKTYLMEVLILLAIFGNGIENPAKYKGFSEDNKSQRLPNIDRYSDVQSPIDRAKNGHACSAEETAAFKQQCEMVREFSGIMVTTHAGCASPLLQQELQPDLIIIDDASNMSETTSNYIMAHFEPKAWVITGDGTHDYFQYDEAAEDHVDWV
ncbi:hypothetical protein FPOAC1_003378 [Fusarium poae]|uniref:hypothetical protein n=1 Tax=Fusarium poae TaxID=36050 RepID=UPI001CEA3843|nr:hypothetical protein FPOAC1_003378 [Fusarium poae]KAG8677362.1 hypothetical protein FPOAC1_003378 [Fusarium poae]